MQERAAPRVMGTGNWGNLIDDSLPFLYSDNPNLFFLFSLDLAPFQPKNTSGL
jgi:hypothetical protein